MGQKDIGEKMLEAYNDVFADIVNVLLFNGEEVLKEDELEEQAPRYAYKAEGKYREIERDVAKRWKNENIRVACVGIENQTNTDKDMPLRVLAYDGAEYRTQLNSDNQQSRYPVVTLVLYFNYKKKWDAPLSLIECLDVPEKFRPFVHDYKINLFDIAYLSPEQVQLFKSDFKCLPDYFVQMRTTGTYKGNIMEVKHMQETLHLMAVMTGDNRFEDVLAENAVSERREIKTMCEVLDEIEARGRAEGEARGRAEGEARGRAEGREEGRVEGTMKALIETAKKMIISKKLAFEDIAGFTGLPLSRIHELAASCPA